VPSDLSNYPLWQKLVDTNPAYRKAWLAGTFPPGQGEPREPGMVRKAVRYAGAVARWVAAGSPERSADEVERIFDTICKPCEFFREGSCRTCGCRVARSGAALLNKIKMATEKCPKGKW
jgi:hypothetical protein